MKQQAVLALEDGSLFYGQSIGSAGTTTGEVVFNTAITGYQEILTDPSYAGQLVTLTFPHIGNTGCNTPDEESTRPMAAGLIVRDVPMRYSNWRGDVSLNSYLEDHGIVAIAGIDTRRLTRILREKGAQGESMVLAGDHDLTGLQILHRVIGTVMTEFHLDGVCSNRQPKKLNTQTNTEHGCGTVQ